MRTPQGLDRLNQFADGVVAIAMTLLVLPLVDISTDYQGDLGALLSEGTSQIFAFLLSFLVIARFWLVHHRIAAYLNNAGRAVVAWTILWLLCIVFLPVPTELIGQGPVDRAVATLYIGTLLAGSVSLAALTWLGVHQSDVPHPGADSDDTRQRRTTFWMAPAGLALALVLAALVPGLGMYAMLVLLAEFPVARLIRRRAARTGSG